MEPENSITMSKKLKQKAASKPTQSASSSRKYLIWGALLLATAGGAYFWFGKDSGKGPKLSRDSGEEPTLTAKNPRLKLLSSSETGIDFQNKILEDNEHNVILNINQYNGGGVAVADIEVVYGRMNVNTTAYTQISAILLYTLLEGRTPMNPSSFPPSGLFWFLS